MFIEVMTVSDERMLLNTQYIVSIPRASVNDEGMRIRMVGTGELRLIHVKESYLQLLALTRMATTEVYGSLAIGERHERL